MAIPCRNCGAEPRDGARFCDACGSPVAVMDSNAEYKQVTVLFADVVRSMDIAASVGPERLREIMTELFNRSSRTVQRYGGTVDKFTGDGIMAVFGAPIAFEDHALRACRAALDVQKDAKRLSAEVEERDNIVVQLRVGLNSGEVITGEIGAGPLTYTAVGEQVGMAQRMESVAAPGGVMVSESTARLVEISTVLGEPELVQIKGAQLPVPARRLLGVATGRRNDRALATFVGREWERSALNGLLDRAINGNGAVVGLVGPPGIGKSRLVREIAMRATHLGAEVVTALCESHTADVPFHAAASLLRATTGTEGLDDAAARAQIRTRFSWADDEDLLILEDLLGIGDPEASLAQIDPDARRRRVMAMVNAAALARSAPTVYVIEDAHWIDDISESMLADFISVVPRTRSLVLITYRPEYAGALAHAQRAQTIALEPLDDSQMAQLSAELLGDDRSVAELVDLVSDRAGGNPFFAEEIVRDLKERDVLIGGRGCYLCVEPARDVSVPSTLQAVIAARIDRLDPAAKRALNAAAVIGSQFSPETLAALGIEPVLADLVQTELVDQIAFGPAPRYAFRHGLIRAVAYESQLKSDRAQLHRRLAQTVEQSEQNAPMIAEHYEAAGDVRAAYEWHMRAGAWSSSRDISAARASWQRARQLADALPDDDPDRLGMRIAPRTNLCATTFRSAESFTRSGFNELRELCEAAGDKRSLAVAMLGQMSESMAQGHMAEAAQLASEQEALLESIGDPDLTLAMLWGSLAVKQETGQMGDVLRWSQLGIDIADGDPVKASIFTGSPLALALVFRGFARAFLGIPGWRNDFDDALTMAHEHDLLTFASVVAYKCAAAFVGNLLVPDEGAFTEMEEAFQIALDFGDHNALGLTKYILGAVLVETRADVRRGRQMLAELNEMSNRRQFFRTEIPILDLLAAREEARGGNVETALQTMRAAVDTIFGSGQFTFCAWATSVLVIALLEKGADAEAEAAVERLVAAPIDDLVVRDVTVLRLRALLAQARGDDSAYRDFRDRYRAMATGYGYQGHMATAAAMP
ncbi:adenylate/guanylate cyclase domain-containing protein [Mycobacterium sp. NPDC048908]|uniref:adenylate/guanylate cyclase domain-containing protein n=1 Tax=Mycobacterium sp. NPDC048908 TaxID=3364292 RepID=UPI00370FCF0D